MAVAALAALESLLSAKVADGHGGRRGVTTPTASWSGRASPTSRSSLFGGMPATGAIARTAVNVRAGARTRVSAIVHGIVLVASCSRSPRSSPTSRSPLSQVCSW